MNNYIHKPNYERFIDYKSRFSETAQGFTDVIAWNLGNDNCAHLPEQNDNQYKLNAKSFSKCRHLAGLYILF